MLGVTLWTEVDVLVVAEQPVIKSDSDLEAVILAETYDLLSSIVGPYMYKVSGAPGQQQAVFASAETQALFYIRVHEFFADATQISSSPSAPKSLSLFSAGGWLCGRYPAETAQAGLDLAYRVADQWLNQLHRIVFWAPSVSRHLRLELSMKALIAMRANLEKHQLLRLNREIQRLRTKCKQSGCVLTAAEVVAVREEFEAHICGMLEYHATHVAEIVGRYFYALHRFVQNRFLLHPTNVLDDVPCPEGISDDVFRYVYASTIVGFSGWTEARIRSAVPETAPSLKATYPQHRDWSDPEFEQGVTS